MSLNETKDLMFRLRAVRAEDSQMIWEWANDPVARSVSFSSDPIAWESHSRWFAAKLMDPCCLFFIVLNPSDIPIGQIRFEVVENEAVISISLAPDQRGKGYGSGIIQFASQNVFASTNVEAIHAYIKPGNQSSIRAFTRAGFSDSGSVEIRGNLARKYTLQRKTKSE